jgi:hypothetical protein
MRPPKKSGPYRTFNRLSENVKSVLLFSAAFALICVIALTLQYFR